MVSIILGICLGITAAILINGGIVWLICWCLKAIGVTSIFGWTVSFSWPLVILFTVIVVILNGIFRRKK